MKNLNRIKYLLIVILFSFISPLAISNESNDLAMQIKALVDRYGIKSENLGISVRDSNTKEAYYLNNSQKSYIPASLTKLITAAAVLKKMSTTESFSTQLHIDGRRANDHLNGNIYIQGGGDPTLVSEKMILLVEEFKRTGIKSVSGDIIVDDSFFDKNRYGAGRSTKRVDRAFDAPLGGLSFNWNSVTVFVRPGNKVNEPLKVHVDPPSAYIKVISKGVTKSKGKKTVIVKRIESSSTNSDTIVVEGALPIGHKELTFYKSIRYPDYWAGYSFKYFLEKLGVKVTGKVKLGKVSHQSILVAKNESKPLSAIVSDMMKYSNNFVAEMLVKLMAAQDKSGANGIDAVKKYLAKVGWASDKYTFVNASGLTRENSFSPAQLSLVLYDVKDDFQIFPEFLSSLPIAAKDGTLKSRMRGSEATGWVRAKTGLLNGVTGLSGYAQNKSGKQVVFVLIYNGPKAIYKVQNLFDEIAAVLVTAKI